MYIAGFVIPVPEEKMEAYRKWAEKGAKIFKEYGCLEIVESWEDNVPDGKQTDFRRAVNAREGRRLSSPGKCGLTRRVSIPPKQGCAKTDGSRSPGKFPSMPSASSMAALNRSTRWGASEGCFHSTHCRRFFSVLLGIAALCKTSRARGNERSGQAGHRRSSEARVGQVDH